MIKSELILPIRFYDNFFEQSRFNKFIEEGDNASCQRPLLYPSGELPHFQIKRNKSLSTVSRLILRNLCDDYVRQFFVGGDYTIIQRFGKELQNGAEYMHEEAFENHIGQSLPMQMGGIFDNGVDPPSGVLVDDMIFIDCQRLKTQIIQQYYTMYGQIDIPISSDTQNYTVKIIIEKLVIAPGSSFNVQLKNNGVTIATITSPGIYTYTFTSGDSFINLLFNDMVIGDSVEISYFQAIRDFHATLSTDIQLEEADVKIIPLKNGYDIISFCQGTGYTVPKGEYYYILETTDGTLYFSEVFQIVPLIDLENYYKLEWYNNCDVDSTIIYSQDTLNCTFKNILYLDAALFQPAYNTDEQINRNGQGNENASHYRWEKTVSLDIVCPEFLADAISGIFLHDNIYLTEPLNKYQVIQGSAINIQKTVSTISSIALDRMQRVILNLYLDSKSNNPGCCNAVETITCNPEDYFAGTCPTDDYYLVITGSEEDIGLFNCDNELIDVLQTEIIYNDDDGKYYQLKKVGNLYEVYRVMPKITDVTTVSSNYVVTGTVLPHTWVEIATNADSAGYVVYDTIEVDETGNFSISVPTSLSSGASDFKIRIENSSLECDFGTDIYDVI